MAGGLTDVLGDTRIRKPGADTSIVVKSQWAAPLSSTATVNKQPGEPAPVQTWDEPSITVSDLMAGAGTFEVSAHSGHHRHAFVKKGFVDHTHCDRLRFLRFITMRFVLRIVPGWIVGTRPMAINRSATSPARLNSPTNNSRLENYRDLLQTVSGMTANTRGRHL